LVFAGASVGRSAKTRKNRLYQKRIFASIGAEKSSGIIGFTEEYLLKTLFY